MTKAYRINIDDITNISPSVISAIDNGENYIKTKDYTNFYMVVNQTAVGSKSVGAVTSILYAADIDPLDYLKEIPSSYLYESPITGLLTIPYNIEVIHTKAFQNSELKEVEILSDKVETLHAFTFAGCRNLEKIYIPPTVTTIARYVFDNCPRLKSINYQGTVEQWKDIVKALNWCGSNTDPIIYCVDGKLNKFDQVAD